MELVPVLSCGGLSFCCMGVLFFLLFLLHFRSSRKCCNVEASTQANNTEAHVSSSGRIPRQWRTIFFNSPQQFNPSAPAEQFSCQSTGQLCSDSLRSNTFRPHMLTHKDEQNWPHIMPYCRFETTEKNDVVFLEN